MSALARDPAERFQTAREMAAGISRVLLQRQELVDSHVLEVVIAQLITREHTSPGPARGSEVVGDSMYGPDSIGATVGRGVRRRRRC
ncbi:MAG: hypothetical protein QM756_21050 [Polyangiaceae bacterium]